HERVPRARVIAASRPMSTHIGQGITLTIRSAVRATGDPSVLLRASAWRGVWAGARPAAVEAAVPVAPAPAGATPAAANPPAAPWPAAAAASRSTELLTPRWFWAVVRPPPAAARVRDARVGVAAGALEAASAGVAGTAAAGTATGAEAFLPLLPLLWAL